MNKENLEFFNELLRKSIELKAGSDARLVRFVDACALSGTYDEWLAAGGAEDTTIEFRFNLAKLDRITADMLKVSR